MKCHEKNSELQRKYNLLPRPVYLRKQTMGIYMYCIKEKIKQNFGKKNLLMNSWKQMCKFMIGSKLVWFLRLNNYFDGCDVMFFMSLGEWGLREGHFPTPPTIFIVMIRCLGQNYYLHLSKNRRIQYPLLTPLRPPL